ncbi:hypothetical protein V8F44DRAFT_632906 [Aspergillus fumigatus]
MYDNHSGSYQWRKHIYGTTAAVACIISGQRLPSFLVDLLFPLLCSLVDLYMEKNQGRSQHGHDACWIARVVIQSSLASPLQSISLALPVVSQMTSEMYDCIPAMLGLIYALIKLTDKAAVVDNWSLHMCKLYGEDFGVMKELVIMRLC